MPSGLLDISGGKGEKRKEVKECKHSLFSPFPPEMSSKPDGMVVITALQLFPGMRWAGADRRDAMARKVRLQGRCNGHARCQSACLVHVNGGHRGECERVLVMVVQMQMRLPSCLNTCQALLYQQHLLSISIASNLLCNSDHTPTSTTVMSAAQISAGPDCRDGSYSIPTHCALLELPAEIRLKIYELLYKDTQVVIRSSCHDEKVTSLLQTCKFFACEVTPFVYANVTFHTSVSVLEKLRSRTFPTKLPFQRLAMAESHVTHRESMVMCLWRLSDLRQITYHQSDMFCDTNTVLPSDNALRTSQELRNRISEYLPSTFSVSKYREFDSVMRSGRCYQARRLFEHKNVKSSAVVIVYSKLVAQTGGDPRNLNLRVKIDSNTMDLEVALGDTWYRVPFGETDDESDGDMGFDLFY